MEHLVMRVSSVSGYFLPLRRKYIPQHSIFENFQAVSSSHKNKARVKIMILNAVIYLKK
jgi:hypothetical protein